MDIDSSDRLVLPPRRSRGGRGRRRTRLRRAAVVTMLTGITIAGLFALWFYLTPSGDRWRYLAADSLISTQHRNWAKYLIGERKLRERIAEYEKQFDRMAEEVQDTQAVHVLTPVTDPTAEQQQQQQPVQKDIVTIENISGKGFKGYLVSISDPKKIRLAVPQKSGKGELVSEMVKRTGAIAGVNAGGFDDPSGMGNGFLPIGIIMSGGRLLFNDGTMDKKNHVVGIDSGGMMIAGKYSPRELMNMHVMEAVTFAPRFIVNGKGQIGNAKDGWGIAPRTAMAQKADGTIMFAIIDGRQTHSVGASLYDVQQLFLEHGAIIAANLDGGSSTILVKGDKIINSPASEYGERPVPSAFLIFEQPERFMPGNPWEGQKANQIDPLKW